MGSRTHIRFRWKLNFNSLVCSKLGLRERCHFCFHSIWFYQPTWLKSCISCCVIIWWLRRSLIINFNWSLVSDNLSWDYVVGLICISKFSNRTKYLLFLRWCDILVFFHCDKSSIIWFLYWNKVEFWKFILIYRHSEYSNSNLCY